MDWRQQRLELIELTKKACERHGTNCRYCNIETIVDEVNNQRHNSRTIDHLVPKSKGGTNDIENLVIACWACNKNKRNMSEEDYKQSKYFKIRLDIVLKSFKKPNVFY